MYRDLDLTAGSEAKSGMKYMIEAQNEDGGWGGSEGAPSSFEETALSLIGLSGFVNDTDTKTAFYKGADHLTGRISEGKFDPAPIGLYFQSLWYYEKLYPLIWGTAAMGEVLNAKAGN